VLGVLGVPGALGSTSHTTAADSGSLSNEPEDGSLKDFGHFEPAQSAAAVGRYRHGSGRQRLPIARPAAHT
jgi:hypothetical protein